MEERNVKGEQDTVVVLGLIKYVSCGVGGAENPTYISNTGAINDVAGTEF